MRSYFIGFIKKLKEIYQLLQKMKTKKMKEEQLNLWEKIVNGKKKKNTLDFIILF